MNILDEIAKEATKLAPWEREALIDSLRESLAHKTIPQELIADWIGRTDAIASDLANGLSIKESRVRVSELFPRLNLLQP